jgi:hypothetical protein
MYVLCMFNEHKPSDSTTVVLKGLIVIFFPAIMVGAESGKVVFLTL